jgi:CBS domain-containing protein
MEAVRVRDVMQPLSEFIDASQSVAVARQRMQGVEAIRSLLVVDESRRLVGAVRYADLSQADASVTVGEVATVDPPTAQVDQPLQELVGLMTESGLDRLPVVDAEGIVIGELPRAMLTTAEHTATTGARTQSDSYSPLGVDAHRRPHRLALRQGSRRSGRSDRWRGRREGHAEGRQERGVGTARSAWRTIIW